MEKLTDRPIQSAQAPRGRQVQIIPAVERRLPSGSEVVKKRVAAYARVSTDYDEQIGSFETQVAYYARHIQGNPEWTYAGVYSDADAPYGLNPKIP